MDEIFKTRFIEEIIRIASVKERTTKIRMRLFAALSFILAFGATISTAELVINMVKYPAKRHLVYYVVTFIMTGFAVTFWLTFVIFLLAYIRNAQIRSCLNDLSCEVDKDEYASGDKIKVNVSFQLRKRELKEVRLVLSLRKESILEVLDFESISVETPFKQEIVLGGDISARDERYSYEKQLTLPDDAQSTHLKLERDRPKIIWNIDVYFDFNSWYSYNENVRVKIR